MPSADTVTSAFPRERAVSLPSLTLTTDSSEDSHIIFAFFLEIKPHFRVNVFFSASTTRSELRKNVSSYGVKGSIRSAQYFSAQPPPEANTLRYCSFFTLPSYKYIPSAAGEIFSRLSGNDKDERSVQPRNAALPIESSPSFIAASEIPLQPTAA